MVWGIGVSVLQKKSLRTVFSLPYNDHTNCFFKNSPILKLNELYKFNLSKSMFNYISNPIHCNDYISSCLSYNSNYHRYQTKKQSDLSIIHFDRNTFQSSFIYQGTKVWNNLPQILKIIISADNFKFKLKKKHFWSHY